jgi:toxin ParE1/3/4
VGDNPRVMWTEGAIADLESIVGYIAMEDPAAALRVLDLLQARAAALESMARRGRVVPELQRQGIGIYRELVEPPWRILLRAGEETVWILAVIDGRRNVEDLLLERLMG